MPPEPYPPQPPPAPSAAALEVAVEAWKRVGAGSQPADRVVGELTARHRLGGRERRWVGDAVFTALRHHRSLLAHLPPDPGPARLLTLAAAGVPPPDPAWPPPVRHSLPDWLWERLLQSDGAGAEALAAALNLPAPLDLRVNLAHTTREAAATALAAAGVAAAPVPGFPAALRLAARTPLEGTPPFAQGWLEVQDAGSQLIAPLLSPQPGHKVVDLCAGGGGKTLHLADLMGDRGEILACDVDSRRLAGLRPRLKRARVGCVRTLALRHERDPALRSRTAKADGVLVDVPCSGTGTLRRHPELKWRLTPDSLAGLVQRQLALLEAGAALVRPGGRLVYATCSLLEEENRGVVEGFLRTQPAFRLRPVGEVLTLPAGAQREGCLRLDPARHGCDGFFAALLIRR